MENVYNTKCKICGTTKISMNCEILLTPDDQPYNNVDYEDVEIDILNAEMYLDSYSILYCKKCKKFDEIEKHSLKN